MKGSISWNTKAWESIGVVLLMVLWTGASFMEGGLLLPNPIAVIKEFWHIITIPQNLWSALVSLGRGFFGIGSAVVMGACVGYAAGRSEALESLLRPLVSLLKAIPVVSMIILLIFWFNNKVPLVIGFVIAFPVVYHGVLRGTRETDSKLLEMAKVYNVPKRRVLTSLYLPSLLPYLVAALDAAVGMGWKSVIAAEVISYPRAGIGTQLMNAKYNLVSEPLFAWTLLAVMISYLAELGIRALHGRMSGWKT